VEAVTKSKPSGVKGIFFKKISVSSTMGVGVRVDHASLQQ
jgi:large subunit ribosomal protein L1